MAPGADLLPGTLDLTSDNNRKAKFYTLTTAGRRRLKGETDRWHRTALAMDTALRAQEA
jgi:PadR family transcriptional regulator PadR